MLIMKRRSVLFNVISGVKFTLAILCLGGLTTSCVNDPEHFVPEKLQPIDNPMSDLDVPNGFDWATTYTLNVKVNVNDVYSGQYYYVVEVWDNNPVGNEEAHMLSKGVAKRDKPYETSFSIPSNLSSVYVTQTDPRGRTVVRSYPVSKDTKDLVCDFSVLPTVAKRALNVLSGSDDIAPVTYTTAPADAVAITGNTTLQSNTSYKISGNYSGSFTNPGVSSTKIFVEGTWTVGAKKFNAGSGVEIIVLPAAKINAQLIDLGANTRLSIMRNGVMQMDELVCAPTTKFYNLGTFKADVFHSDPVLIYNGLEALMEISDYKSWGNTVYNYGYMKFGYAEIKNSSTVAKWYNYCSVEATDDFMFHEGELVLDHGLIHSANRIQFNQNQVTMLNGSMLSADKQIVMGSTTSVYGGNSGVRSLVQSPKINISNNVVYSGYVTVEADDPDKNHKYDLQAPAEMAGYKKSSVLITPCEGSGSEGNEGNEGGDPSDPQWPLIINDATTYNYAFEDNWPVYGDYDMNDVVIYITNRQMTKQESGAITSYKIQGRLMAVGASKKIAAAVQLANLPVSSVKNVVLSNAGEVGMDASFFVLTSANIEKGQANAVIPIFSEAHKFIGSTGLINTLPHVAAVTPKDFEFEVQFDAAKNIKESDLDMAYFDLFLITDEKNVNRQEVHLPAYNPTDRANLRLVGSGNCANSAAPYLSTEGLSFGLMIPYAFRWPVEYAPIREVYGDFPSWVRSAGQSNKDWYLNASDANRVYPAIK